MSEDDVACRAATDRAVRRGGLRAAARLDLVDEQLRQLARLGFDVAHRDAVEGAEPRIERRHARGSTGVPVRKR